MIGTEGMGLFSAFNSVTSLVGGIAGMGISNSGVRQIAEAVGSQDRKKISRTVLVLRRTSLFLGFIGMLSLLALSKPISLLTFGTAKYTSSLALLSVTILFAEISGGQSALIQGMRRIRELATLSILGAVTGTFVSLPIIYVFREKGIVPFLVIVSAFTIGTSWWYAKRIKIEAEAMPLVLAWSEARALLGMGAVFMANGLMVSAVAYLTRTMVIREINLDAAGLYQAAYALSGVYVGFVLSAMGADYYPRLTAVAEDNREINRLVNEQTEAALLMAVPGILATLTFAPLVIHLLYSSQFSPATSILRWQLLGILGRIITWPIGFVLLAKGAGRIFFLTELLTNLVHLSLLWFGMRWFGLDGLGMAFFYLYVFYAPLIFIVVRRECGFRWTAHNLRLGAGAIVATMLVFFITDGKLGNFWSFTCGGLITATAGFYAASKLSSRAGFSSLREFWNALAMRLKAKFI